MEEAAMEPGAEHTFDGGAGTVPGRSLPVRWIVAFGKFWWDFLVGETPELFVGTLVALGLLALLVHAHVVRGLVDVALPVLVIGMLLATVLRPRD